MNGNAKENLLFWLAILSGLFSIASFFVALSSDQSMVKELNSMLHSKS